MEQEEKSNKPKNDIIYEYLTGDEATKRWQFLREKAILDERAAYINGKTRGKEEGEIVGEKRGEKQGRIKTAMEMIKDNVNLETIVKYTKLSKKEVEELFLEKV